MSYLIRCYTLFDITNTGVRHRSCPVDQDPAIWSIQRNQQCNFDTVVQSISIRSLPEMVSSPRQSIITKHRFGEVYKRKPNNWQFDFTVSDITVWKNEENDLYHLYHDCDGIPMIIVGTEVKNLPRTLSTKLEDRNIYFEVLGNET